MSYLGVSIFDLLQQSGWNGCWGLLSSSSPRKTALEDLFEAEPNRTLADYWDGQVGPIKYFGSDPRIVLRDAAGATPSPWQLENFPECSIRDTNPTGAWEWLGLEVATACRLRAGAKVPRAAIIARPLQHLYMTICAEIYSPRRF